MIQIQKLENIYADLKESRKLREDSLNLLSEAYKKLNEEDAGVTGTLSADIANAEHSVNDILLSYYMEREIPSIPRDVLNIVKMRGHTNLLFTIQSKPDDSGIEIVKQRLSVFNNSPKRTSVTLEALHDIFSVHGLDGIKLIANFLRDRANREENINFVGFLTNNAVQRPDLTLSEPANTEMVHFEVSKRVQQYIYEMNTQHQRTFEAFAIVPYIQGGAITGLNYINSIISDQTKKLDNTPIISTYRIAREILTDYYINPDITDNNVYVGLRSRLVPSCSAGVFGSYQESIRTAVAYETAEQKFFLFNRYGIALNPAHTNDDPMIIKFKLTNWTASDSEGGTCVCSCKPDSYSDNIDPITNNDITDVIGGN